MEEDSTIIFMGKIFKIYNSVSTDVDLDGMFEVKDIQEVFEIIRKYWNVGKYQVRFEYNSYSTFYVIKLTNKLGETFAYIGDINFNPYEEFSIKNPYEHT